MGTRESCGTCAHRYYSGYYQVSDGVCRPKPIDGAELEDRDLNRVCQNWTESGEAKDARIAALESAAQRMLDTWGSCDEDEIIAARDEVRRVLAEHVGNRPVVESYDPKTFTYASEGQYYDVDAEGRSMKEGTVKDERV